MMAMSDKKDGINKQLALMFHSLDTLFCISAVLVASLFIVPPFPSAASCSR
jgi:hypothetical protein